MGSTSTCTTGLREGRLTAGGALPRIRSCLVLTPGGSLLSPPCAVTTPEPPTSGKDSDQPSRSLTVFDDNGRLKEKGPWSGRWRLCCRRWEVGDVPPRARFPGSPDRSCPFTAIERVNPFQGSSKVSRRLRRDRLLSNLACWPPWPNRSPNPPNHQQVFEIDLTPKGAPGPAPESGGAPESTLGDLSYSLRRSGSIGSVGLGDSFELLRLGSRPPGWHREVLRPTSDRRALSPRRIGLGTRGSGRILVLPSRESSTRTRSFWSPSPGSRRPTLQRTPAGLRSPDQPPAPGGGIDRLVDFGRELLPGGGMISALVCKCH